MQYKNAITQIYIISLTLGFTLIFPVIMKVVMFQHMLVIL